MSVNPWKVLQEETRFSCPYFDIRRDLVSHSGQPPQDYNSIRMKQSGVSVLAVDQQGLVTLVGQHRYVLRRYTWELPGGGAPLNSDPLMAAQRELREETGYSAGQWLKLVGADRAPGTSDDKCHGYIAWELEQGQPQPDATESLSLRKVAFPEAIELVLRGEVAGLISIALLLATQVRAGQGSLPSELHKLLR
jgi:8-oxo-dGTP pyrophosphatase MutT (NUDIX family)